MVCLMVIKMEYVVVEMVEKVVVEMGCLVEREEEEGGVVVLLWLLLLLEWWR